MSEPSPTSLGSIGVIVPCRDEARTIERKLANLARLRWPESARPHRVVVVDDGSRDATAELARAIGARLFPLRNPDVELAVVTHDGPDRPERSGGKPQAIRAGLAHLGGACELVVLTDADVVCADDAIVAIAKAFADEPELAMACGAQRHVASLAPDGSLRAADGGALAARDTAYDRWTARVRRFESARGRLFSVHGQWLAWRASLELAPAQGIAADDLDLRLQVLERAEEPRRVRIVSAALFHEVRPPPGPIARAQALRRARAWFQALRAHDERLERAPATSFERFQLAFYRHGPALAPRLTWILPIASVAVAAWLGGRAYAWIAAFAWLLVLTSPPGWRWARLMALIADARAKEASETLEARWEPPRA